MRLSLIAAMDRNRVIGINNQLPWHMPADLRHFKALTLGKPVLMGRHTFDSLGRPLPGRANIVVTRDAHFRPEGVTVCGGLDEALAAAGEVEEAMVIGGASFYAQCLPRADRLYLTVIQHEFAGDAWFPEYDARAWRVTAEEAHEADERNAYAYRFLTLERGASQKLHP